MPHAALALDTAPSAPHAASEPAARLSPLDAVIETVAARRGIRAPVTRAARRDRAVQAGRHLSRGHAAPVRRRCARADRVPRHDRADRDRRRLGRVGRELRLRERVSGRAAARHPGRAVCERPRSGVRGRFVPGAAGPARAGRLARERHVEVRERLQGADWLGVGIAVPGAQDAAPNKPRTAVFRAADVEIVENWSVVGMQGTGSHDLRVDDRFVPEAWTLCAAASRPSTSRCTAIRPSRTRRRCWPS